MPGSAPPPALELGDPSIDSWSMAEVADLALTVEREALAADPRVSGVEQAVYAGSADRVAIVSSTGIAAEYESSSCYAYAMVLAKGEDGERRRASASTSPADRRHSIRSPPAARAPSAPRR